MTELNCMSIAMSIAMETLEVITLIVRQSTRAAVSNNRPTTGVGGVRGEGCMWRKARVQPNNSKGFKCTNNDCAAAIFSNTTRKNN